MRIMAIDYGDAHTGIAISDQTGLLAGYTTTLHSRKPETVIDGIRMLVQEYSVTELVLGYPKNMDNTEGIRCEKTKQFQKHLQNAFPKIPIILWDERMSTMAAQRSLLEADMSRKKRKNVIDKMAAVHILQGYLDKKQNEKH